MNTSHYLWILIFLWFLGSILVNQPTVHSGGISRGRVCGCGRWRKWHATGDRWHVTPGMWHLTPDTWHLTNKTIFYWIIKNNIWCLYPNTSTDSVSLAYRIFSQLFAYCPQACWESNTIRISVKVNVYYETMLIFWNNL